MEESNIKLLGLVTYINGKVHAAFLYTGGFIDGIYEEMIIICNLKSTREQITIVWIKS